MKRRNARSDPSIAIPAAGEPFPTYTDADVKKSATGIVTVVRSPSRPSVKFVPFTVPITAK